MKVFSEKAPAALTIEYFSERTRCLIRGSNTSLQPNVEFADIMGPGFYVTVFIHGNTIAGSEGSEQKLRNHSLMALALKVPTMWSANSGTVPVRAIGVAVEGENVERAGIAPLFDELFGADEYVRTAQISADFRTIEQARQMLATDVNSPLDVLRLEASGFDILLKGLELLRQVSTNRDSMLRSRLLAMCDAVESDLARSWTMVDLARLAGMSVRSVSAKFRDEFGLTPFEFLRERRLLRARDAIINDGSLIADAARLVGFTSAAHFSSAFKKQFGIVPGDCKPTPSENSIAAIRWNRAV